MVYGGQGRAGQRIHLFMVKQKQKKQNYPVYNVHILVSLTLFSIFAHVTKIQDLMISFSTFSTFFFPVSQKHMSYSDSRRYAGSGA